MIRLVKTMAVACGCIAAIVLTMRWMQRIDRKNVPFQIRAAIPYWDQDRAVASYRQHSAAISSISLFWYYLAEDGSISRYRYADEDPEIIRTATMSGDMVSVVLTNLPEGDDAEWDTDRVSLVLTDSTVQKKHFAEIVELLLRLQVRDVTIDYEMVDPVHRDDYSEYLRNLTAYLHPKGMTVGVSLHPKTGTADDNPRYEFQDWATLSRYADALYIMSYGEHWDGSEAGPVASYEWFSDIIRYARDSGIDLTKTYMGCGLYAYDWTEGRDNADGMEYDDVRTIVNDYQAEMYWDSQSRSPYLRYTSGGEQHVVWYENQQSIGEKVRLAYESGFAGVTFWRLGGEDAAIWKTVTDITGTHAD